MIYQTLIDTAALRLYLEDPDWVIFDCRFSLDDPDWGEAEYRAGHIPGARYAHIDRDLAAPPRPDSGRHPLPDSQSFGRWLGRMGVGSSSQVVVYDQAGGMFAARLWWMLRHWLGHPAVAVLDGGWAAWHAAGGPVTDAVPRPAPARFEVTVDDQTWLTSAQLESALAAQRVRLVDARGAARFRGDTEPIDPRPGHIPGALNRPFADNLDERGRFRDPATLRRRFQATAELPADGVVHMCGSGVSACHNLLATAVAGLPDARLYVGSWSEWLSDPRRPVATGDETA